MVPPLPARALHLHIADVLLLTGLSIGAFVMTARMALEPRDPQSGVAVIFSPWTTPETALRQAGEAGGRFVRFGGMPFVAVVIPDDVGYPSRVLAAGAWFIADPQAVAACLAVIPARSS